LRHTPKPIFVSYTKTTIDFQRSEHINIGALKFCSTRKEQGENYQIDFQRPKHTTIRQKQIITLKIDQDMQGLAPAGVCGVVPNTPKTVFLFILCIVLFGACPKPNYT